MLQLPTQESMTFEDYYQRTKDEPKYVILGCQGSGTNLVSRLLQQSLHFSVVHDRSLIFNAAVEVAKSPTPATIQAQFQRFRRRVFPGSVRRRLMLKRHYRQAKHFQGLPETIDTSLIRTGIDFANFLYAYPAYSTGARYQGLKSDDLWESLDWIETVIPRRRYLLLVRDPRDNAISITNKDFGPRNLYAASEYVRLRMWHYQREIERQAEEDVIRITYEDLLNEPQQQMERVARQWQLELRDDYLTVIGQMNIRSHNQQKWKKLPPELLRISEGVLGSMTKYYGYEPSDQDSVELSRLQKAYWRAGDLAQRVPQRAYKTCRNFLFP